MQKRITDNQVLGELGETAVKKIVLESGFLYDPRGRLEAGTDGLIELRDRKSGAPLGKLLGVQVKSRAAGKYTSETDASFEYLVKPDERLFHFHAISQNKSRNFKYPSSVKDTSARVVSYYPNKKFPDKPGYVRHHAASLRFERLGDEWFVVIDPTFYFTRNGFTAHPFPGALLSGKKRLERNAAVRGQVIMWQSLLAQSCKPKSDLFEKTEAGDVLIGFEPLPLIELEKAVPEDTWERTDPRAGDMKPADLFDEGLPA